MRSLISKYLHVLSDHQVTHQGVGARHRETHTLREGGRYLDNYTKLELSLSAHELEAAFECLELPAHWSEIQREVGALKFLELWRGLESLRTGHRLRINVARMSEKHNKMSAEEFEHWLDAQRLSKPWFEIYYASSSEQYRYIWQTLYNAAYTPQRKTLRIYVPSFNFWNNHLKRMLMFNLLHAGVPKDKISHHLLIWTGQTASQTRINLAVKLLNEYGPSFLREKTCEIQL